MRLVKIKLADSQLWFLGKLVSLNMGNSISGYLDIDKISEEERQVIDRSCSIGEIRLFNVSGARISNLKELNIVNGELAINTDDVIEDEGKDLLEVFSVTVDDEPEDESLSLTDSDYENARILLNKNGNTVRKTIRELSQSTTGLAMLHACLEIEEKERQRSGIIQLLEQSIMEF